MSALDLESSLQPVSPEQTCGPDLQYDVDFIALEEATQGKPEQQYGDTIIPAEEPDWNQVKQLGLQLLSRTKDLRIACHLARALVEKEGLGGFRDALALIHGYVATYWEGIHPQLDPEDDNDPTERVNVISSLADKTTTVAQIIRAPLVRSPVFGAFSYRDIQVARGELPALGDDPPPEIAAIEAAFLDCDIDTLQETIDALEQSFHDATTLESMVTDHVGAKQAPSLESLTNCLKTIRNFLQEKLNAREGVSQPAEDSDLDNPATDASNSQTASTAPVLAGEIRSREDVIRSLDKICSYYDRQEPSSPLPILLKRAKRLVTMSFMDILEDLTPDGLTQARIIEGEKQPQED